MLCFTKSDSDKAMLHVDHHTDESDTDGAVRPGPLAADAENDEEQDVHSDSSQEGNILNDREDHDDAYADQLEADSAAQPAESHGIEIDADGAARPGACLSIPNTSNENAPQATETLDAGTDTEAGDESLDISALEATTSAHDDWLHRGPFLFDMDFHTYIRFTVRRPRAKDLKVSEVDRAEHYFLFDSHYALAASHWQQLVTDGHAKLVVMEALKCPLPSLNNGEDNAVFKSLMGTLIKCPGPGHCADPRFCKAGFFQVTVPESSNQTPASEMPDWIDHEHFTPQKCPLCISRRTHADDVASTFSCRLQWKARRAEIAVLAEQAADLMRDAKRIPVLADTTLVRGFKSGSAAQPAHSPPHWRFLLCLTQMWMKKSGQAFPPFARTVLDYIGLAVVVSYFFFF